MYTVVFAVSVILLVYIAQRSMKGKTLQTSLFVIEERRGVNTNATSSMYVMCAP